MDLPPRSAAVLVLAVVAACLPCMSAEDQLAVGDKLLARDTIVSDSGDFALGFFSPDDSPAAPARRWYLGIWYHSIPGPQTVVWVANRDAPAAGEPTLALANDSSLVLSDADGSVLWTTPGVGTSSSQPAPAELGNDGNLLILLPNGTVVWQSFDHPTDTFMPGMKARLSRRTERRDWIVSWTSPRDPAPGPFSCGLDPVTSLQLLMWNRTRLYSRTPVWTGYAASGTIVSAGMVINTAIVVVGTEEEISITFTVSGSPTPTRYVVTSSGTFQLLRWNGTASAWDTLQSWPSSGCTTYGRCGAYGYCDATAAPPSCKCLDGFEPAIPADWSAGRFEQGCRRTQALPPCGGGGHGFLEMRSMKVPDNFSLDAGNRSPEECAARCAGSCSCVAYAYVDLHSSSARQLRCLVWAGELVDAQMIGAPGQTLYLRVPVAATSTGGNAVKIAVPVAACVLVLTCIFFAWFWRFRGNFTDKRRKTESQKKLMTGSANTPSEVGEGDHTGDLEFPSLRFADIVAATGNFSKTFMIGRGGFGNVYKGTLDGGHVVAVKRLSKDSDQGAEEFKNEAILIAKLQHRNLVRLLGCCTEGAEKLLIYEYLPNKGLDAILFDSARKSVLDWSTRLGIIKGVARGLLYLHQDSRLTVIHRDLKASNVLLDAEMRPKIADFGMAKIFGDNQVKANSKRVVGTYGYIAPEYSTEGVFSVKSDVYSFGVLLLEIVSGVRISTTSGIMEFPSLIVYAWHLWREGKAGKLVDPSMAESCLQDEALLCIHVGLLCVEDDPSRRPLMSSVVSILENGSASVVLASASLPEPNKPGYVGMMEEKTQRSDLENSRNTIAMTVLQGR
ncbi:G-type lectin S-receptor-like serine/threonine-protein kinase B120 [Hordeum vulgare subsp. vulgare]|uniref:Receptor-like serine/threonine-protein kinase n=1 Tax=Hordeum vulgare subsp. vulgare TaxID=112509 RepID=A0A8I6YJ84_HORVV|nr:G-type lectin S-receptor-like serine/threonine-protein kinase B120 [Hordeum vulgare subsp. vulgare]